MLRAIYQAAVPWRYCIIVFAGADVDTSTDARPLSQLL